MEFFKFEPPKKESAYSLKAHEIEAYVSQQSAHLIQNLKESGMLENFTPDKLINMARQLLSELSFMEKRHEFNDFGTICQKLKGTFFNLFLNKGCATKSLQGIDTLVELKQVKLLESQMPNFYKDLIQADGNKQNAFGLTTDAQFEKMLEEMSDNYLQGCKR